MQEILTASRGWGTPETAAKADDSY